MSSAIYYSENAFRVDKSKTYGRQVAGNDFLQAYCKSNSCSKFWVYAKTTNEANDFTEFVKSNGINKGIKFINFENTAALKEPGLEKMLSSSKRKGSDSKSISNLENMILKELRKNN